MPHPDSEEALVDELRNANAQTLQFCSDRGINFDQIQTTTQAFVLTNFCQPSSKKN